MKDKVKDLVKDLSRLDQNERICIEVMDDYVAYDKEYLKKINNPRGFKGYLITFTHCHNKEEGEVPCEHLTQTTLNGTNKNVAKKYIKWLEDRLVEALDEIEDVNEEDGVGSSWAKNVREEFLIKKKEYNPAKLRGK